MQSHLRLFYLKKKYLQWMHFSVILTFGHFPMENLIICFYILGFFLLYRWHYIACLSLAWPSMLKSVIHQSEAHTWLYSIPCLILVGVSNDSVFRGFFSIYYYINVLQYLFSWTKNKWMMNLYELLLLLVRI